MRVVQWEKGRGRRSSSFHPVSFCSILNVVLLPNRINCLGLWREFSSSRRTPHFSKNTQTKKSFSLRYEFLDGDTTILVHPYKSKPHPPILMRDTNKQLTLHCTTLKTLPWQNAVIFGTRTPLQNAIGNSHFTHWRWYKNVSSHVCLSHTHTQKPNGHI